MVNKYVNKFYKECIINSFVSYQHGEQRIPI